MVGKCLFSIDIWRRATTTAADTAAATTTSAAPATAGAAAAAVAIAASRGAHGRRARAKACAVVACSRRTAGRAVRETRTASAPGPATALLPAVSAPAISLKGYLNYHAFTNINHFVSTRLESCITSRGERVDYGSSVRTSTDAE